MNREAGWVANAATEGSMSRRESDLRGSRDPSTLRNRTAEQIVRVFPSHDSRSER